MGGFPFMVTDIPTDERTDERTDGRTDGHTDELTNGQTLLQRCEDASKKKTARMNEREK